MSITPRIFLIDDQPAVLKALSRLLGSAGYAVTSFGAAQDFLDSGNTAAAGCVVLDLAMPGMNGLAMQLALKACDSALPIIFLTGHGDIDTGVRAMKLGAFDFLTKPVDDERLLAAVHAALERNHQIRSDRTERDDILQRLAELTPREREVLSLVVEGKLNKQVAADLGTVEKTIKVHRARVMTKMKVRTLAELVRLADKVGIRGSAGAS
ncbi:MAG: response regulator [Undibacterium sp.]|nr:response regulator [Undibacterium sp.]